MTHKERFILPGENDFLQLSRSCADLYSISEVLPEPDENSSAEPADQEVTALPKAHHPRLRRIYYDTFDSRLLQKNLCLYYESGVLTIADIDSEIEKHSALHPRAELSMFSEALSPSPLKSALSAITENRRLFPIITARIQRRQFDLADRKGKIRIRLFYETIRISNKGASKKKRHDKEGAAAFSVLLLSGLRGYHADFENVRSLCELHLRPFPKPLFRTLAEAAGIDSKSYTSKLRLTLQPEDSVYRALSEISRYITAQLSANIQGVVNDYDTEFLHDFRVSVRRIRSLLSQVAAKLFHSEDDRESSVILVALKNILDQKDFFSSLGAMTNEIRDADVFLADKEIFLSELPARFSSGLNAFFHSLSKMRLERLKILSVYLQSKIFIKQLSKWESDIEAVALVQTGDDDSETAMPVLTYANKAIRRRYAAMKKTARLCVETNEPVQYHALRIQGKKLRYLLEFFASLYPADEIASLIQAMKKLQDTLGALNDTDVQERFLTGYVFGKHDTAKNKEIAAVSLLCGFVTARKTPLFDYSRKLLNSTFSPKTDLLIEETF